MEGGNAGSGAVLTGAGGVVLLEGSNFCIISAMSPADAKDIIAPNTTNKHNCVPALVNKCIFNGSTTKGGTKNIGNLFTTVGERIQSAPKNVEKRGEDKDYQENIIILQQPRRKTRKEERDREKRAC